MGVNSLPMTVTRQRRGCDLNPGPSVRPESSTLTTRLQSRQVSVRGPNVRPSTAGSHTMTRAHINVQKNQCRQREQPAPVDVEYACPCSPCPTHIYPPPRLADTCPLTRVRVQNYRATVYGYSLGNYSYRGIVKTAGRRQRSRKWILDPVVV